LQGLSRFASDIIIRGFGIISLHCRVSRFASDIIHRLRHHFITLQGLSRFASDIIRGFGIISLHCRISRFASDIIIRGFGIISLHCRVSRFASDIIHRLRHHFITLQGLSRFASDIIRGFGIISLHCRISRFASDIIIRGFDTPCKLGFYDGKFVCENLNYAGLVTRFLQPILPVFFTVQFAFLYDGWKNEFSLEQVRFGLSILFFGGLLLTAFALTAGTEVAFLGVGAEALLGVEGVEVATAWFAEQSAAIQEVLNSVGSGLGL